MYSSSGSSGSVIIFEFKGVSQKANVESPI